MKYVILLYDTEAARGMTEAEGQQWYAEIGAWYGLSSSATPSPAADLQLQFGPGGSRERRWFLPTTISTEGVSPR